MWFVYMYIVSIQFVCLHMYTVTQNTKDSVAMCGWGVVVAIGKGYHAITENKSFIIKSVQACFVISTVRRWLVERKVREVHL